MNAKLWILSGIVIAAAGIGGATYSHQKTGAAAKATPSLPQVVVSKPLIRDVDRQLGFLGQFSAVERVELCTLVQLTTLCWTAGLFL